MMRKRPNFFIIGAPKCGTTSLYDYLGNHHQVSMASTKEPHYFASDLHLTRNIDDETAYFDLFRNAGEEHLAIGEASTMYLYSGVALARIKAFAPEARLVAMVRNPLEMAPALHAELLRTFDEDVVDFGAAWALQSERANGRFIPARCREPALLQYGSICRLGQQIARLNETFPPTQRHIILFDDFKRDTAAVYRALLNFLGLEDDGRVEFGRRNQNASYRSRPMGLLLRRTPRRLTAGYRFLQRRLGIQPLRIRQRLMQLNLQHARRASLDPGLRAELVEYFADDIALLARTLQRPLDHWLSSEPAAAAYDHL